MMCFQVRLYLIKASIQIIKKKEEHVSFVAYLITNVTNAERSRIHLHERSSARKIKIVLFDLKSVIMQIRVPEKITNVKTAMANIILVFVL